MDGSRVNGIKEKQKKQAVAFAVFGGSVIAAILLVTTIWVLTPARR